MRVWVEGKEINPERYDAFLDTLPPHPHVPQLERIGEFPEIPPTPDAEKEAWTDELIARIKRDNWVFARHVDETDEEFRHRVDQAIAAKK